MYKIVLFSLKVSRLILWKSLSQSNNFRSTNKKDNSTRWRCVTRTCDPKLYTDTNNAFTQQSKNIIIMSTINQILIAK
jgi:hypothetical protein